MPFLSNFLKDMLWKILFGIDKCEDRCIFGNCVGEKLNEMRDFLFNIVEGKNVRKRINQMITNYNNIIV